MGRVLGRALVDASKADNGERWPRLGARAAGAQRQRLADLALAGVGFAASIGHRAGRSAVRRVRNLRDSAAASANDATARSNARPRGAEVAVDRHRMHQCPPAVDGLFTSRRP